LNSAGRRCILDFLDLSGRVVRQRPKPRQYGKKYKGLAKMAGRFALRAKSPEERENG
jgi:hypothetical protein